MLLKTPQKVGDDFFCVLEKQKKTGLKKHGVFSRGPGGCEEDLFPENW